MTEIDYKMPFNLGNPSEFKVSELAELVLKLTDSKSKVEYLPLPEDDPKQRQPDISKVKKKAMRVPKICPHPNFWHTQPKAWQAWFF